VTRNAVVLASSKGIGFGVAFGLAAKGFGVTVTSSNKDAAEKAAADIAKATGATVKALQLNLKDDASVDSFIAAVTQYDKVDVLVLNGPGPPATSLEELTPEVLALAMRAGVLNEIRIAQALLPGMKSRGFGRLIALTSTTGKEPDVGMICSNVTRAAMLAYVKTVSREYGKFGITANSVLTGGVLSDRLYGLIGDDAKRLGRSVDDLVKEAAEATPVGFIATPQEFAKTICFLASDDSAYLNGVALPLDGGYMKAL
jgi:3-oxoacyl-[acyl-carrier protein] reductase